MTKCQVFYTKKAMFFYDITFFDFFYIFGFLQ